MIKEFISKWEDNKDHLRHYFSTRSKGEFDSYEKIVGVVVDIIINDSKKAYDLESMTVIDGGDYQGAQIFIIPRNTYQPSITDYIWTHSYYGSCSGCDTLQGITSDYDFYDEDILNERQIDSLMTLSLHLIQRMKCLGEMKE